MTVVVCGLVLGVFALAWWSLGDRSSPLRVFGLAAGAIVASVVVWMLAGSVATLPEASNWILGGMLLALTMGFVMKAKQRGRESDVRG